MLPGKCPPRGGGIFFIKHAGGKDKVRVIVQRSLRILGSGMAGELGRHPAQRFFGRAAQEGVHQRTSGFAPRRLLGRLYAAQGAGIFRGKTVNGHIDRFKLAKLQRADISELFLVAVVIERLGTRLRLHEHDGVAARFQDLAIQRQNQRLRYRWTDEADKLAALDAKAVANQDLRQFIDPCIVHAVRLKDRCPLLSEYA